MNEEYEGLEEEICVNCNSVIYGSYRHCPFCGEIWYVRVQQKDQDINAGE